jgi:hypothetical protein
MPRKRKTEMPQAVVCLLPRRSAWRKTRIPAVVAIVKPTRNSAVDRSPMAAHRVRSDRGR